MFTIGNDLRWDRTDAMISQARDDINTEIMASAQEARARLKATDIEVMRRNKEIKDRNTHDLKVALYERDYYRNALIMLCEGKRESIKDIMSDSRKLYTRVNGWKY